MSFNPTKTLCCWLLFGLTVLLLLGQTEHAHARTMTCDSTTLNYFKSDNEDPKRVGMLILTETTSWLWSQDRDTCGAHYLDESWSTDNACQNFLDFYINSDEALSICAIGRDPTRTLGFTRGGASLTNVTLYKGEGSTSGVNVARDTYATLSANTYYRVTYNTGNDGRRVLTFTTNSASTGLADSSIRAYTDEVRPVLTISDVPPKANAAASFSITILANEDIVGLEAADIQVTNGTASNLTTVTDYRKFTVTITPDGNGDVTMKIPGSAVTDLADNANNATAVITAEYSDDAPIVTIGGVPSTTDGSTSFIAYYNFSYPDGTVAPVTGFDIDDVKAALVNATVSGFTEDLLGNSAKYWATITPDGNGSVSVGVNADAAQDSSGFGNLAATTQVATLPDTQPPTVVITNDGPKIGGTIGTLDGSGSSDASGIASYEWVQVNAADSNTAASTNIVSLSSTTASAPTFTVPGLSATTNLYFKLTVTDNANYSASAWTTYVVNENTAPSLTVSNFSVSGGTDDVDLGGGISTTDSDITSWAWVQVDGNDLATATEITTGGVTITNNDTSTKSATFDAPDVTASTAYYFKVRPPTAPATPHQRLSLSS